VFILEEDVMTQGTSAAAVLAVTVVLAPVPGRTAGDDLASLPPGRLAERIHAELGFAEGLAKLHPDRQAEWALLLEKARALAAEIRREAPRADDAPRVAEAERVLAPLGAVAKTYVVHNVGHAHIDMNWMWPWPETVAVTNDTFTTVLKLMDEFPDFRFT
jgi:alpha-mannosidase